MRSNETRFFKERISAWYVIPQRNERPAAPTVNRRLLSPPAGRSFCCCMLYHTPKFVFKNLFFRSLFQLTSLLRLVLDLFFRLCLELEPSKRKRNHTTKIKLEKKMQGKRTKNRRKIERKKMNVGMTRHTAEKRPSHGVGSRQRWIKPRCGYHSRL